jgi:hypothetical protein
MYEGQTFSDNDVSWKVKNLAKELDSRLLNDGTVK